jgi:hypothetical protein
VAQTAQELCNLARQDAKTPGYTSQSGVLLNMILAELCETYDFATARGTQVLNFNPSSGANALYPNVQPGAGPYPLNSDFLRMWDEKDAVWYLNGVPYPMIPCDLSEYDNFVQQSNMQAYPYIFATDVSQSPPNLLVWPPASGSYQVLIRYVRQMPDISTPETSSTIPWFPQQQYLRTRLAGELMKIVNDDRWKDYLSDQAWGAQGILSRYLKLKDDDSDRAKSVKLDRRQFNSSWSKLPSTKVIGW